jgi:hypothetical protein
MLRSGHDEGLSSDEAEKPDETENDLSESAFSASSEDKFNLRRWAFKVYGVV